MLEIIYPSHYRIVECRSGRWFMKNGELFYSRSGQAPPVQSPSAYGISPQQVAIALFRINGGKAGYYLANLRDRHYYYCGSSLEDVKVKLQELGIGVADRL